MVEVNFPEEYSRDADTYRASYYLKDALKGKNDVDGFAFYYKGCHPHLALYRNMLAEKGVEIRIEESPALQVGDRVIVSQKEADEEVCKNFEVETQLENQNLKTCLIKRNRNQTQ